MGYRVSMRVLDPGPTGAEGVVLPTQRRGPAGASMRPPTGSQKVDFTSSYHASFIKKSNSNAGLLPVASSSGIRSMMSPKPVAKSTSLPRLVEETSRPEPVEAAKAVLEAGNRTPQQGATLGQQRALLELLGDPQLEKEVRKIFKASDSDGTHGSLSFKELIGCLDGLSKKLGIHKLDTTQVQSMFKKYDVRCDQQLDFGEFFELLTALLRQHAFSRRDVVNREFFVTKNEGKVWDTWEKVKKLGEGSFGTAFLAKNHYGDERVVKSVKKSRVKMPVEDVEREIMVMRQVDHPHIVRLFGWYEDRRNIYLIMEALKGGTLQDAVLQFQAERKGVKEEWIREVMRQVIAALAYCHSLRLIHKDIKDENIMLLKKGGASSDKPFAVVIDLGIAEMFTLADPQGRECGGTPLTMAPEVWSGGFGPKCDVWSLGCVLYELFTGTFPFMATSMNPQAWIRLHKRGPDWALCKMSHMGTALCKEMLHFQEDRRPTMAGCLMHEWFTANKCDMKTVTPAQMQTLQAYCKESLMKRTMLMEIASRLPMHKAQEVVDAFEMADADSDGKISKRELAEFLRQMGAEEMSPSSSARAVPASSLADRVFKAMDADGNGELSFTEFAAGVLPLFKDLLDDLVGSWMQEYDGDQDGVLDEAQANRMMAGVSKAIGKQNSAGDIMKRRDSGTGTLRRSGVVDMLAITGTPAGSRVPSSRASRR